MRGIILTLMVFLAMASVTFGAVTWNYIQTNDLDIGGAGYRTIVVQATADAGTNLNCLQRFEVMGNLHQVQPVAPDANGDNTSVWVNDYVSTDPENPYEDRCPVNPEDSYVMYGNLWFPDLKTEFAGSTVGPTQTTEALVSGSGVGANFINYNSDTFKADAYVDTNAVTESTEPVTVNLLQLVIPDGQTVSLDSLFVQTVSDYDIELAAYTTTSTTKLVDPDGAGSETIYSFAGDCDLDGDCDLADFSAFSAGYFSGGTLYGWENGNFDGDTDVDLADFSAFSAGYFGEFGVGGGSEGLALPGVPEPTTMVLLVLGSLCLAGYRLRK